MVFPERNLNQTAVYWGSPVDDGYGRLSFSDPEEISCRWNNTTKVILDQKGYQVVISAVVQVAQDLEVDGMLFLGTLDDLDSAEEEDPENIENAKRIQRFDKTPTIKGSLFVRIAYL